MTKQNTTSGFTLMEILVAMAIMGILATVGFAGFSLSFQKARDAQRKSDLNQLSKAIEAYDADFGLYPPADNGRLAACTSDPQYPAQCAWGGVFSLGNGGKVYMKQLPKDPAPDRVYRYVVSSDRKKFQIFAMLENPNDPQKSAYPQPCGVHGESCTYGIASTNASVNEVLQ